MASQRAAQNRYFLILDAPVAGGCPALAGSDDVPDELHVDGLLSKWQSYEGNLMTGPSN
jgi:hypothetical protein